MAAIVIYLSEAQLEESLMPAEKPSKHKDEDKHHKVAGFYVVMWIADAGGERQPGEAVVVCIVVRDEAAPLQETSHALAVHIRGGEPRRRVDEQIQEEHLDTDVDEEQEGEDCGGHGSSDRLGQQQARQWTGNQAGRRLETS